MLDGTVARARSREQGGTGACLSAMRSRHPSGGAYRRQRQTAPLHSSPSQLPTTAPHSQLPIHSSPFHTWLTPIWPQPHTTHTRRSSVHTLLLARIRHPKNVHGASQDEFFSGAGAASTTGFVCSGGGAQQALHEARSLRRHPLSLVASQTSAVRT
jgi:hypothetical protein